MNKHLEQENGGKNAYGSGVSQGLTAGLPTSLSKKTMGTSLELYDCTVTEQYFSRYLIRLVTFPSVTMVEMKKQMYFCIVIVCRLSRKSNMKKIDNILFIHPGNKYKDKIWQPVLFVSFLVFVCGSMLARKDLPVSGSRWSRPARSPSHLTF